MAESMRGLHRTHRCAELSINDLGKTVTVMGWVAKYRNKGGLIFIDLRDRTGILQLVYEEAECGSEVFKKASMLRNEFVVAATGVVIKRASINENIKTGEIEIRIKDTRILSSAETPPFEIVRDTKTKEELRLKYRYLDLRRPDLQERLMLKSRVMRLMRDFMAEEGFIEIETPIMCNSTPEGARDYLVPSRVNKGSFYALPQSPQVLKQLLMLSGFDRYFQIARCFRDEDLRADRQPEFTQADMELSFVDVEDVLEVNERLIAHIMKEIKGIDIKLPIQRLRWKDAMNDYGSDKPDTRFDMKLVDVSDVVQNSGFSVFTKALELREGSVRGINVKGQAALPRKKIDAIIEKAKGLGAKGLSYLAINEDGSYKSSFAKFMTEEEITTLIEKMQAKNGDLLLFAADKNTIVWNVLGAIRLDFGHSLGLIDENAFNFVWIVEFPLLGFDEEENRYVAEHHPFTAPMEEDWEREDIEIGSIRAKAYDIVLNGYELGGGSVRIYQSEMQEKMFELLGFSKEEAYEKFGFLLNAFKYGVPPHAGLAFGLDRFVMLLAGADNIREVIAFPKNKDAQDLMLGSPNRVDSKQLQELGIKIGEYED